MISETNEDLILAQLENILNTYRLDYKELRNDNSSLNNEDFFREHGLWLKVPDSWPLYQSIRSFILDTPRDQSVVIIYSNATVYSTIRESTIDTEASRDIKYIAWPEIYYAIHNSSRDIRPWNEMKVHLEKAGVIFFVDALNAMSADPVIIDHVRMYATGCLIMLG